MQTREGKELSKQECEICDESGYVRLMLWERDVGRVEEEGSYKLIASPIEAIQYMDGDGGFIVSECFPLLDEYLQKGSLAVPTVHLQRHDYHLIPFRESHHNAIKLGHEYMITYDTEDSSTPHQTGKSGGMMPW